MTKGTGAFVTSVSGLTLLQQALNEVGIEASSAQQALLARHLELVIDKNRTFNLTRIEGESEGVYLHVIDSLLLLGAFSQAPMGSFLDMGTGAGYPGIPLAIMTGRKATLADSVRKKAAAVSEFVDKLGLGQQVEVCATRIEELGRERKGAYSVVTARAVAQTNVLVEYAAPLLRGGGRLVVAKARPTEDEVAAGDRAAALCGLERVSRETLELPHGKGHREVLSYERVGKPRVRLPRPTGMAKKQPLGVRKG